MVPTSDFYREWNPGKYIIYGRVQQSLDTMKLYAYIQKHTRDVRIVTRSRVRQKAGVDRMHWANNLVWSLTTEQYRDIFKVVPMENNLKDAMRLAVQRGMHYNTQKGKGHQSFVWSRGGWELINTLDSKKVTT